MSNKTTDTSSHLPHFIHYWRSSCSWRVRWAFAYKNVSYTEETVNLLTGEQKCQNFIKRNPQGYVPALQINGTTFAESMAILEWIEETHPNPTLLPGSAIDRLTIRQICQMIVSGTQPLQNLAVMKQHSSNQAEQQAWAKFWIAQGLNKVERVLEKTAGTYSVGGVLSMADLCLIPQIYNAKRFSVDLQPLPICHRIYQHCLTLESCQKSLPENQPSAKV